MNFYLAGNRIFLQSGPGGCDMLILQNSDHLPLTGHGLMVCHAGDREYRLIQLGRGWCWVMFSLQTGKNVFNDPVYFLMRNSYASIALFDWEYDRPGGEIFETQKLPSVYEGTNLNRTLILYNDEYTGTDIEIQVRVVYNNKTISEGARKVSLALGEHVDIPVSFQVPVCQRNRGGYETPDRRGSFQMLFTTVKNGVQRFEEHKVFYIRATGYTGSKSSAVKIGEPRKSDF